MAQRLFSQPSKPNPKNAEPFLMPIEDVFNVKGRGTVVVGRVQRGILRRSDTVEIVGLQDTSITTIVDDFVGFIRILDYIETDDTLRLLIKSLSSDHIRPGMVLAQPGSI